MACRVYNLDKNAGPGSRWSGRAVFLYICFLFRGQAVGLAPLFPVYPGFAAAPGSARPLQGVQSHRKENHSFD